MTIKEIREKLEILSNLVRVLEKGRLVSGDRELRDDSERDDKYLCVSYEN